MLTEQFYRIKQLLKSEILTSPEQLKMTQESEVSQLKDTLNDFIQTFDKRPQYIKVHFGDIFNGFISEWRARAASLRPYVENKTIKQPYRNETIEPGPKVLSPWLMLAIIRLLEFGQSTRKINPKNLDEIKEFLQVGGRLEKYQSEIISEINDKEDQKVNPRFSPPVRNSNYWEAEYKRNLWKNFFKAYRVSRGKFRLEQKEKGIKPKIKDVPLVELLPPKKESFAFHEKKYKNEFKKFVKQCGLNGPIPPGLLAPNHPRETCSEVPLSEQKSWFYQKDHNHTFS